MSAYRTNRDGLPVLALDDAGRLVAARDQRKGYVDRVPDNHDMLVMVERAERQQRMRSRVEGAS